MLKIRAVFLSKKRISLIVRMGTNRGSTVPLKYSSILTTVSFHTLFDVDQVLQSFDEIKP